ncbi:hypothetical protein TCAL_05733 [Tigriopus californicus]|uniref:Transmembrane protein 214 n=1 Tax=Tigriopus californicus TaxID=6832 RepID=A0A553N7W0_TIGCA|nr:transmembrane protein 214-A-like [Tigriopus californicus]TRY61534.1 hypothetical protein TCAL_05733 [Tigriopus californicus]|eukprot:TCALIF_05733-PA protein Name:"Similar to tmem214-a Transmembrane protein 214-A (Xenopus laevis)" AED:0.00 eAED:0.00 QI:384/1/1/1/0.9/0.90/11/108/702
MSSNGTAVGSGGWEKVKAGGKGGKHKAGPGSNNGNQSNNKKAAAAAAQAKMPKWNDVLPLEESTRFTTVLNNNNGATKSSNPGSPAKSSKTNGVQKKKPKSGKENGTAAKESDKKPATLQEAVKKVNITELKSILTSVKSLYPDNQIIWLRDAASYFNVTLATEQPLSLDEPFVDQPLALLNKETKKTLTQLCQQCSEGALHTGFETLLANLVHDMARNVSGTGYLVMLQLMADQHPSLCIRNSERYSELMNSYQNRSHVGKALLWTLGQGGKKDLAVGFAVWTEFMLPVLSLKNYSRFVVDYLVALLERHKSSIRGQTRLLCSSQFLKVFDAMFVNASNLNKELQASLLSQYQSIKVISIGDCSNDHELFTEFLRRVQNTVQDPENYSEDYKQESLKCLEDCLTNNKATWKHWHESYITFLPASAQLLMHLDENWSKLGKKVNKTEAKETFEAFQDHNESVSASKEGVTEAFISLESLLSKMGRNSTGSWFPWKTFIVLLFIGLATIVNQDVIRHGSFKASKTGVFLKDVGLYEHTVNSYEYASRKTQLSYKWTEKNVPIYYKKTQAFVLPYWKMVVKVFTDAWQYIQKTTPVVVDKLNEYIPGIKDKLVLFYGEFVRIANLACKWLSKNLHFYGNIVIDLCLDAIHEIKSFLVLLFNGRITLTDISNIAQNFVKSLKHFATELYKWTTQQIQAFSASAKA